MIFDVKNPRKTNSIVDFWDFVTKMCELETLVYKGKTSFTTKTQISKTFRSKNILEDILAIICGNVVSVDKQGFFDFCGHIKMW